MAASKLIPYATPDDLVRPEDHLYLRTLAYCYWGLGSINVFGGTVLGVVIAQRLALLYGSGFIVFGALLLLAGYLLSVERHSWLIVCIGGLSVLSFPFGTLLGIITIVELRRPRAKRIFFESEQARAEQKGTV